MGRVCCSGVLNLTFLTMPPLTPTLPAPRSTLTPACSWVTTSVAV